MDSVVLRLPRSPIALRKSVWVGRERPGRSHFSSLSQGRFEIAGAVEVFRAGRPVGGLCGCQRFEARSGLRHVVEWQCRLGWV